MKTNLELSLYQLFLKLPTLLVWALEDSIGAGRSKAVQTLSSAQQHNIMTMKTSVPLTSHELIPGVTL